MSSRRVEMPARRAASGLAPPAHPRRPAAVGRRTYQPTRNIASMTTDPYVTSVLPSGNAWPRAVIAFGRPGTVGAFDKVWVRANAMFSVPRVTMNAGSRAIVTRVPFSAPNAAHTPMPMRIASGHGTPPLTASRVITIVPNAITAPLDRSMPAVRMTTVWPMASVPTSITCWTTSERLPPVMNRSVFSQKNRHARTSAARGPTVGSAAKRAIWEGTVRAGAAPSAVTVSVVSDIGSAPAVGQAELDVLGRQSRLRLGGHEVDARVGVAAGLLAALGPRHDGVHALAGHLQRVLLRGRRDLPGLDRPDAGASAVDRDDHGGLVLAGRLQRGVRAERRRLVDRVHEVDAGFLLQAVL